MPTASQNSATADLDQELLARIRSDDERAFELLFRQHYGRLCQFVQRYVGPTAAEDVVQEMFFEIWHRRHRLGPVENVRAYLFGAARNRALNEQRRQHASDRIEAGVVEDGDDRRIVDSDMTATIEGAIRRLPEDNRLTVMLRFDYAMSHEQIAFVYGSSIERSQKILGRALRLLRPELLSV